MAAFYTSHPLPAKRGMRECWPTRHQGSGYRDDEGAFDAGNASAFPFWLRCNVQKCDMCFSALIEKHCLRSVKAAHEVDVENALQVLGYFMAFDDQSRRQIPAQLTGIST